MKRGGSVSGAVSLVMIFCVLCLAVFSVLTLSTAVREQTFAERAAESAESYYQADREATEIVAALAAGEIPASDVSLTMTVDYPEEGSTTAEFALPAGRDLLLEVHVRLTGDGDYEILRWSTVYAGDWTTDDYIDLWDF